MKVTLNWLKQYVDFNWSPEELTERLTILGLEVEGVQKISAAFEGIVVAQVITRDKHPNADKLSVCRVNDGTGERQIVCGAQNFKAGDKVPLILPGASLPPKAGEKEPFTIKVGKIRSVESHGMLCSHEELGLDPEAIGHKKEDGLLILREDAKVGQPFAEYLGRSGSDVVYDLEVTPNRPDLNSLIGIAREIAALTGNELKIPVIQFLNTESEPINGLVSVQNDEPELCPRYTARIVRKVKVGPSPDWLKGTLEKVGIRSINNVVDITNYVMLEVGQPLHAFDYHLLKGLEGKTPKIVIRRAAEGEKFTTLDGKERTLTNQTLLIADETRAVALAGVMGGKNSEINDQTVDVLIESANFKPQNIRATSKKLELRTDSSYRYERGGDVGICDWASRRAVQLICDLAGGQVLGHSIDNFPHHPEPKQITLHFAKSKDLLGVSISHQEQVSFLEKLGMKIVEQTPGVCTFSMPSWRVDMKREVDLIEEVGRLHGIEKIPSTPPRGALGSNAFDSVYDQIGEVRRILAGLGLNEAQGQTLISKSEVRNVKEEEIVALANPLSSDMDVLRPSLLPGLLHSLRHNINRKHHDVALFEIGRVFTNVGGQTKENRNVAIAITGQRALPYWSGDDRNAKFDAYDLKGLVEEMLEQFGLRGVAFGKRTESTALFLESAAVTLGGKLPLGELGQLLPVLAKKYDLRDAVFLAEFNLDLLLSKRNPAKSFKTLPQFPSSRRDVAMLVPEVVTHDAVLSAVKQAKAANLESVELFDVFRGQGVPAGQKSFAYAFTYRATDKTLTDAEVNSAHEKIIGSLKTQLQAEMRA
ncbi:MAG TPA: phenylalanine--tRNA ligase subunit beta [Verrucomicrobiae bacterium]|nr:phenylalanine--tRNA ligase subunit beta [Verrucomicrobiae bacterium]